MIFIQSIFLDQPVKRPTADADAFATWTLLPPVRRRTFAMCRRSSSSRASGFSGASGRAVEGAAWMRFSGRSSSVIDVPLGQDLRPLEHVRQFADVARPVVPREHRQGFGVDCRTGSCPAGRVSQKCSIKERDVFAPLPQRRQADGDHVEPIEQVLAETPVLLNSSSSGLLVAATTRTSACRSCVPPTRR